MISGKYFKENTYANRGMILESDINETNKYYLLHNIALIYKKPTPIKVVKVEYPKNIIKEAYFNEPSTLYLTLTLSSRASYNGVYKGRYIEFDAKETKSKTSFPISNIHKHQIEHIKKVLYFGGIPFLIVRFTLINKTYILLGRDLIDFINNYDRKSIPLKYFEQYGFLLELKYTPRLDYIQIIDKLINVKDVD